MNKTLETKAALRLRSLRFVMLAAALISGSSLTACKPVTVVKSSATAWVWVPAEQVDDFVHLLQGFATMHGLQCNPSNPPSSLWPMTGVIIVTPKDNEISILNGTDPTKFQAAITLVHPEPDWNHYWADFRDAVRSKYKWQDMP